jgi:hypothetical protein
VETKRGKEQERVRTNNIFHRTTSLAAALVSFGINLPWTRSNDRIAIGQEILQDNLGNRSILKVSNGLHHLLAVGFCHPDELSLSTKQLSIKRTTVAFQKILPKAVAVPMSGTFLPPLFSR